jgi:hypothetical protein
MISVIGIGNTGCNIAKKLQQYPQYETIEVDEGINVKKQRTPEDYEKNCPNFRKLFANINEDVFIVLSASGNISGITLRLLESLKDKNLNVICLLTDGSLLSNIGKLQQKIVSNVLQEYARSGLLEKLYLIHNSNLETLLDDVPLDQYYDKLNEVLTYTLHSIMCVKNTKPLFETKEEISEIDRIYTIGLYDMKDGKKSFFDLNHVTKERYYFSFSKEDIKKDGKLLQNIKNKILKDENNITKTFAIYESKQTDQYGFIESSTHIVQNL